jgi:low affinity Fe/Cu permease
MVSSTHRHDADPAHPTREHAANAAFSAVAQWASIQLGRASTFMLAFLAIILWGVTGPIFGFSDTWQLVINTGTTIVTFLMVFLIQNTQNRDMSAIHLKLDELIRVNQDARNQLMSLEDLTEEELKQMKRRFSVLASAGADAELASAAEDLGEAEREISEARSKVETVAARRAGTQE